MRAKRMEQRSIFDSAYPDHDTGRALAAMSDLLDGHPEFLDWIAADVDRGGPSSRGRAGLPCEVVLRCGILKHLRRMDYRDLEFALVDSDSARRFTRVDPLRPPKRSALQRCIAAVRPATWEKINRALMGAARRDGIEEGRRVRIDSTVTETHILEPSDSQLLYDTVFHKGRGLGVADMASSPVAYGRLRRFRAGMEAVVSYLKRRFGLGRCNWRGLEHFRAYVWSAVVTHNLWVIALRKLRLKPA